MDINYSTLNIVLAAELRRLELKNNYLCKNRNPQKINEILLELQAHLEKKLVLINDLTFDNKSEKILTLRIVFELAPIVLDYHNNKEIFCKLYDESLLLVNYINENFIKKSFAEYVINVFNRKAFLFAPPSQASIYYEQAVSYFRDNKIWEEYAISLASKAGNEIAIYKYAKAIDSCNEAISTIEKYELTISQSEKIYNNLYIADFLLFEANEDNSMSAIKNKATTTINKLEGLLTKIPNGTNHVILTNIAALYLYINRFSKYYSTKKRLEQSLNCKDVSDINNISINDFYRYHFAWYEYYINLKHQNWGKCKHILDNLKSFYPSIFHNIEKMDLRVDAAYYLVNKRYVPPIRKYGINMLQFSPLDKKHYLSRGLLLSDLQFTSWE